MTWIGSTPHSGIGMTEEKYSLLKELAQSSEYWRIVLVTVDSTSCLKLTSLSNSQRARLMLIIIELDVALYERSWRLGISDRHTQSIQETKQTINSFDRMRSIVERRRHP